MSRDFVKNARFCDDVSGAGSERLMFTNITVSRPSFQTISIQPIKCRNAIKMKSVRVDCLSKHDLPSLRQSERYDSLLALDRQYKWPLQHVSHRNIRWVFIETSSCPKQVCCTCFVDACYELECRGAHSGLCLCVCLLFRLDVRFRFVRISNICTTSDCARTCVGNANVCLRIDPHRLLCS
jgi:hypothetical protein